MPEPDKSRSLEEIEDDRWAARQPTRPGWSARRTRCANIPSVHSLISQQVGLDTLVPLALERVEREPLAEGDFYPGDLLDALMRRVPDAYWQAHEDQRERVRTVAHASLRDFAAPAGVT